MGIGENRIYFQLTEDGKVLYRPEFRVQSTSYEIHPQIDRIAEQTAKYMESLLREELGPPELKLVE